LLTRRLVIGAHEQIAYSNLPALTPGQLDREAIVAVRRRRGSRRAAFVPTAPRS
jgi:hypothetical protein